MDSPQNMQPTTKKTCYHDFFPVKSDEALQEATLARLDTPHGESARRLVELPDIYPAPVQNPDDPWLINRILTLEEVTTGKIIIPFQVLFEHILRYWTPDMADLIVQRRKVGVVILDVTDETNPRSYESKSIYLQLISSDDAYILCERLILERGMKAGDGIALYWDLDELCFRFKHFPAVLESYLGEFSLDAE